MQDFLYCWGWAGFAFGLGFGFAIGCLSVAESVCCGIYRMFYKEQP